MKDSVFLSYPQPYLKKQKQFIDKVASYLEERGLQPRTLGVTDYDMDAPLTAIRRLLLESNGLIAIAFRRSLVVNGVTSYEDAAYCAIQNGGLMAIPDGGPLSTVGQKRGHKNMERTTGPSLMGEIFEISAKKGYRHYFYGSKEETLELLYQKLTSNYPGIQIAGMYSPPFRPLTEF